MAGENNLKTLIERNKKAIALRPSIGQGTATTRATIREGLTCDIEDGQWKLVADESPGDGGAGLGPDPGVFGRAALGSCLAIGYKMWAEYFQVPLDSVEVIVEADYDARGMYDLDDKVPPGWVALRYTVHISSPAGEEKVRELVEYADRHSSLLDAFRRAVPTKGELKVASKVGE